MFNVVKKEFQFGSQKVTLETGKVARQTSASVMVSMGSTSVLVTVVGKKVADPSRGFFPLTVNYQEKYYAAGKIPGGFNRREGRPTEKETLTCRLIDRPIRPLFPNGFMNEVQVVATVMSVEKNVDPDIAALIGTSAALAISGIPFKGPIGAARVGFTDDGYVLNPNAEVLKDSDLDLVVAGTEHAVLMVESEAKELTEDEMLGAVLFGHQEMQVVIEAVKEFAAEVNTPAWQWEPPVENVALIEKVQGAFGADISDAYAVTEKLSRYEKLGEIKAKAAAELSSEDGDSADSVKAAFAKVEKNIVRELVLGGERRIDGRAHDTVRPISIEVGVLPETHGSALFTRGETQAIVVATLGSMRSAQLIEGLQGTINDAFMLQYNFPPFCVGETGMMGSPKRREIGHGKLARRGIQAMMPTDAEFPYSIRVVSEITESNGSSSMASVCGASLALMDAGVPVKAPVAGIAMGLVKEGERYAVLSDILGDEDHLGDMDFKVAGTSEGITALQMDIKIDGITEEIMEKALAQAMTGRLHILGEMDKVLSASRTDISDNAPSFITIKVKTDKIRDIIGKGGATIRSITERTGATVDIDDSGEVTIFGETKSVCKEAEAIILEITAEVEVGKIYVGKVARIVDFGAFVTILPGMDGLVHISQISEERVEKVTDHLSEGQEIKVKVLDVDQRGRVKLSMKEVS
ncbi:MAG: polyribonucleotide nucleotidyltransferase [Pseudomonadales bacterium]|nr:polyribonucleotide nucleotidyltransferase [Pseudomonadales bacterium]